MKQTGLQLPKGRSGRVCPRPGRSGLGVASGTRVCGVGAGSAGSRRSTERARRGAEASACLLATSPSETESGSLHRCRPTALTLTAALAPLGSCRPPGCGPALAATRASQSGPEGACTTRRSEGTGLQQPPEGKAVWGSFSHSASCKLLGGGRPFPDGAGALPCPLRPGPAGPLSCQTPARAAAGRRGEFRLRTARTFPVRSSPSTHVRRRLPSPRRQLRAGDQQLGATLRPPALLRPDSWNQAALAPPSQSRRPSGH